MLDFRIDTFLTVCQCMNYTKAAELLHITQPAVSQHIHYLEKHFGHKLFTYEGKKLTLTNAGHILYQACTSMKSDLYLLDQTMQNQSGKKIEIHLGATLTIGEFVIAEKIRQLQGKYPHADFQVTIANTTELSSMLKTNKIQFALVEGSFSREEFDSMVYTSERFIPVCSTQHIFSHPAPALLQDVLSETLIIREPGSGTREILESFLHLKNLSVSDFARSIQVNGMHTIKSMVTEDCGISFLYEIAVRNELKQNKVKEIALNDFSVSHDFTFIWNKNSIYDSFYRSICEFLITKKEKKQEHRLT